MKMNKKRILKVVSALVLAVLMITVLASCAVGGSSVAKDESGKHGELSWEYKKDGQTLTINGKGAMKDFTGNEDIAWKNVVTSVKKVVVGDKITSIGNYAFFGMTALEEVELPEGITRIGKFSFAFTSALTGIDIPDSVKTIGEGAFETSGLVSVSLPASIETIEPKTFMYCDDLETVIGGGVKEIKGKAFAYCYELDEVKLSDGKPKTAADAFYKAKADTKVTAYDNKVTVEFNLVDEDGKVIGRDTKTVDVNSEFTYEPKKVEGYEPVDKSVTVKVKNDNLKKDVVYKKVEADTEPESETALPDTTPTEPKDEKLDPWTIVALVVTVLVIIGIIIGTVLFIRNDKKKGSNSGTVRKDKGDKKDKKKKK